MSRTRMTVLFTALSMVAAGANAAEVPQGPGHRCAAMADPVQRLDCYDAAFGKPVDAKPLPTATVVAAVPAMAVAQPALPEVIESKVTALRRHATGEWIVTLENGQAWEQADAASLLQPKVGDAIRIRRGAFGSWVMQSGGNATAKVRLVR